MKEGAVLGRLDIPRLRIHSVVCEGVGRLTLSLAVGHIPGTAFPGESGNIGIAGHRDTFFHALKNIRRGDLIRFQTPGKTYLFTVESTQVVQPYDVSVLQSSRSPELTLVTCYPFYYVGSAPDRFVAKARQEAQVLGIPEVVPQVHR